jgi:hypothetical protein
MREFGVGTRASCIVHHKPGSRREAIRAHAPAGFGIGVQAESIDGRGVVATSTSGSGLTATSVDRESIVTLQRELDQLPESSRDTLAAGKAP